MPQPKHSYSNEPNAIQGAKIFESVTCGELSIERIHFQHIMCITKIYICSNETTNSKGHTHLAALSGRKERLLEAGHCCARISVVGSSFFRLTRCERFPELCAWGGFNFREKIRFISYPPKRQLNLPTIWVLYIHEKMDQSKGRRRLEATQQPGQLLEAQSNTQTSRSAAARYRAQRRCADVAQRREAKIASIN